MRQIDADYLGGLPDHPEACEFGALAEADGSLNFTATWIGGELQTRHAVFTIPQDEIRAVSLGDADGRAMRQITRTVTGGFVFGALGALAASHGSDRTHGLLVAGRRDGLDYFASFAVRGDHGAAFLRRLQSARQARGEEPLPSVEGLNPDGPDDLAETQIEILRDIRVLLVEQTRLMRRLLNDESRPS